MVDRSNLRLNEEIENHIQQWYGTLHGAAVKNMYDNGCSYESICEYMGLDYEDWKEEEA